MLKKILFFVILTLTLSDQNVKNSQTNEMKTNNIQSILMSKSKSRILLCPIMMKSHVDDVAVMAVELSRRGHEVHFLLGHSFPVPSRIKNYNVANPAKQIHIEIYERPALDEELDFEVAIQSMIDYALRDKQDLFFVLNKIGKMTSKECERLTLYNDVMFRRFSDLKFDMVVVDLIPVVRCLVLIPHRLSVPWIVMTDMVEPSVIRIPYLPSFVPAMMAEFTDDMNFMERVKNTALMILQNIFSFPEPDDVILSKYQVYGEFSSLKELSTRTKLWITSRDVALDYAKPNMPNIIDAGGLTVGPATGKLDANIMEFISNSKKEKSTDCDSALIPLLCVHG